MSTLYVPQPDDEDRQGAINTLLDGLERLYPGQITTRQAIAITTDIPEILQLLSKFAPPDSEPTSPPRKRAPKPRPKKPGSNGSGGPEPARVEPRVRSELIAELEAEAEGNPLEAATEKNASGQVFNWKIMASGKETNSVSTMLRYRKLQPGDRVQHKTRGLFVVAEKASGAGLCLHRLAS